MAGVPPLPSALPHPRARRLGGHLIPGDAAPAGSPPAAARRQWARRLKGRRPWGHPAPPPPSTSKRGHGGEGRRARQAGPATTYGVGGQGQHRGGQWGRRRRSGGVGAAAGRRGVAPTAGPAQHAPPGHGRYRPPWSGALYSTPRGWWGCVSATGCPTAHARWGRRRAPGGGPHIPPPAQWPVDRGDATPCGRDAPTPPTPPRRQPPAPKSSPPP